MPRSRPAAGRLAALALAVLVTAGASGCKAATPAAAPTSAGGKVIDRSAVNGANQIVGTRLPEILDAGDEKLVLAMTDTELVLTSPRDAHDFDEITYVIQLDDDESYVLQFASAADREDFECRVSFKRLFRGTYTVRAYGDKSGDRFADARFRVTEEGF